MGELKPGFYPGVPYDEYAAWPAINHSRLRRMRTTPMHMRYAMLHDKAPTKALDFGWAVHIAVLEPDTLEDQILVIPKVDRRTTAGKIAWASFERKAGGRMLVDETQMAKLKAIRANVLAHPTAREFMVGGQGKNEVSILWVDSDTGMLCKARLDRVNLIRNQGVLMTDLPLGSEITLLSDLKTIGEAATQRAFEKAAYNFGYFEQAAMYRDGVQSIMPTGEDRPFVWVVLETEPPHAVHCFEPDELALQWGQKEYKRHLARYAECAKNDNWPGWADGVDTCSVPPWVSKVFELQE